MSRTLSSTVVGWIKPIAVALLFIAIVIVLMLWLAGRFSPKIQTHAGASATTQAMPKGTTIIAARMVRLPVVESAVGSIRAVHETAIASRITARVLEVNLKAGQRVNKGDILAKLDDTDLKARLQQANATVESVQATQVKAKTDEERFSKMLKVDVATQAEYDRAIAALKNANAELRRAQESVKETQSMLDYATIRAPIEGVIVDKKVDAGDIVLPGQLMATLYDPNRMQLVASVRESLAHRLKVGQEIGVRVDVLNKVCMGQISEIVPEAQSASRTFGVKVTGPCPPDMYTGMFGRILIPLEDEEILVVPVSAVRKVGQLELVDVFEGNLIRRRAVRAGRTIDGQYEILSGLAAGEKVLVLPATAGKED